jgi:hypothetical protein
LNHSIDHLEVDSHFAYVKAGNTLQILDIETPSDPNLVYYLSFSDTLPYPLAFSKKENYLYVSARYSDSQSGLLIAYDLSVGHVLQRVSQITYPFHIRYLDSRGKYMLALSLPFVSLVNLEYPASPCLGEMTTPGGRYGIIRGDYIYTLDHAFLAIFEMESVE